MFAGRPFPLAPFRMFSPAIKSLHITFAVLVSPGIFDLILSFPLIEDLSVTIIDRASIDNDDDSGLVATAAQPSPDSLPTAHGITVSVESELGLLGDGCLSLTRFRPHAQHAPIKEARLSWVSAV